MSIPLKIDIDEAHGQITRDEGLGSDEIVNPVVLIGKWGEKDGEPVLRLLMDYHFFRNKNGLVSCCSRPIEQRDQFQNWPNPEPGAEGSTYIIPGPGQRPDED